MSRINLLVASYMRAIYIMYNEAHFKIYDQSNFCAVYDKEYSCFIVATNMGTPSQDKC